MIILSNTADAQTWTVIPRYEPSTDVTVTFRSESENKVAYTFTYSATYSNGYLSITHTFDPVLTLNRFYEINVKEGAALIWKGKAYVTDQTDYPVYTINQDKFTEYQNNDNEFVII